MTDTSTINSLGGYPLGAENDPRAPYNQKDPEKVKVKVTVSVTYHKDFEVKVEEGYSDADLRDAIEEMKVLPNYIIAEEHTRLRRFIKSHENKLDQKLKAALIEKRDRYKPWIEDELEVIPNGTETHLLF
jgi:vancomycin resistance protein YoaR